MVHFISPARIKGCSQRVLFALSVVLMPLPAQLAAALSVEGAVAEFKALLRSHRHEYSGFFMAKHRAKAAQIPMDAQGAGGSVHAQEYLAISDAELTARLIEYGEGQYQLALRRSLGSRMEELDLNKMKDSIHNMEKQIQVFVQEKTKQQPAGKATLQQQLAWRQEALKAVYRSGHLPEKQKGNNRPKEDPEYVEWKQQLLKAEDFFESKRYYVVPLLPNNPTAVRLRELAGMIRGKEGAPAGMTTVLQPVAFFSKDKDFTLFVREEVLNGVTSSDASVEEVKKDHLSAHQTLTYAYFEGKKGAYRLKKDPFKALGRAYSALKGYSIGAPVPGNSKICFLQHKGANAKPEQVRSWVNERPDNKPREFFIIPAEMCDGKPNPERTEPLFFVPTPLGDDQSAFRTGGAPRSAGGVRLPAGSVALLRSIECIGRRGSRCPTRRDHRQIQQIPTGNGRRKCTEDDGLQNGSAPR